LIYVKNHAILLAVALLPTIFKGVRLAIKGIGLLDSLLDECERESRKEQGKLAEARRKMAEVYAKVSNSTGKENK
jgi:hypothetical protein